MHILFQHEFPNVEAAVGALKTGYGIIAGKHKEKFHKQSAAGKTAWGSVKPDKGCRAKMEIHDNAGSDKAQQVNITVSCLFRHEILLF